jgi:hypothetical protein
VREHLRRAKSGKESTVRQHSRNMNLPERSFLRSALADMQPAIRQDIRSGISEAVKGAEVMDREAIYSALFELLKGAASFKPHRAGSSIGQMSSLRISRRLFQAQRRELVEGEPGLPRIHMLHVDAYIYANRAISDLSPGEVMNPLLDALEAALAPNPITNKQQLGGLVEHVWVEGEIETDEGTLGDQGVCIVPIVIKVSLVTLNQPFASSIGPPSRGLFRF